MDRHLTRREFLATATKAAALATLAGRLPANAKLLQPSPIRIVYGLRASTIAVACDGVALRLGVGEF